MSSRGALPADGDTRGAAGDRQELDRLPAAIFGREEQARRIGRPGEAVHPAVHVFGQIDDASGGAFEQQQPPAIALVSGAELGAVGDVLAVGRILRRGVGARIDRHLDGRSARDRDHVEVGVGAGGGSLIRIPGVADLRSVGRDGVIVRTAERERRNVAIARRQVLRRGAGGRRHHQMRAALALPAIPAAVEQRRVDPRLHFALRFVVDAGFVAGVVGAIRIHFAGEHEILAVRREHDAAGFGRQAGHLRRDASVGVHDPDLRGAAAVGNESEAFGIRRPARALVGGAFVGELPRRPAIDRDGVDLLRLLVAVEVDALDRERDGAAVGRDLRIADARDLHQRLRVKGELLSGEERAQQESQDGDSSHIPDCNARVRMERFIKIEKGEYPPC